MSVISFNLIIVMSFIWKVNTYIATIALLMLQLQLYIYMMHHDRA